MRDDELITEAALTLAVLDNHGSVQPIPDWMRWEPSKDGSE